MSRLLPLLTLALLSVSVAVAQKPPKPKDPPKDPPKPQTLPDLDDATIATYQKAGGKYGAFKLSIYHVAEFVEGKNKCEPGMMVGFDFTKLPTGELTDAKVPFALRLSGLTDGEVKRLKGLTNLAWLNISFNRVGDAGVKELAGFGLKSLTYLNLAGTETTGGCLKSLGGMKSLTVLNLSNMKLTDADLGELKGLTELTALQLLDTPATGEALRSLKGLEKLKAVHLDTRRIDDKVIKTARELNALHKLPVCFAGGWGEYAATDADIRTVSLSTTKATTAAVPELKGLKNLRRVQFAPVDNGDAVLTALADNGLLLAYEGFSDKQGKPVTKPEDVLQVVLATEKFTPASMKHVAGFKNAEMLYLNYSKIGDESIPDIKKLTKLTFIQSVQGKLTADGMAELKKAFPKATVLK